MTNLTNKQEPVDWSKTRELMREWHEEQHSSMTNEKFIDLYVGRFTPEEPIKEDELLRN